jgi:hypothetical protein
MLYMKTVAVCSEMHTKHTDTQFGQNVKCFGVMLSSFLAHTHMKRERQEPNVKMSGV